MGTVKVLNLSFSYDGTEVFHKISFDVDNQDIVCVVGESGIGKTTLLKTIAGLVYEDSGTVYMDGVDMKEIPSHKRRISFVFQTPNLYPHLTIYQNIDMGFKNVQIDMKERHRVVMDIMQRFGISRYANLKPKHLSLGEQQKCALAKCLLSKDELYLLDEPLCSVDPDSRRKIWGVLKEIKREKEKPIIYVSHDVKEIASLATKILILDKEVICYDTAQEILTHPQNRKISRLLGMENKGGI